MKKYSGIIVRESFEDKEALDDLETVSIKEVGDMDNPKEIWNLHKVMVSKEEIKSIQKYLKQGWYMHFWDKNQNVIVVFRDKMFQFVYNTKVSWNPAIKYGLSLGIPKEQLDFTLD